MISQDAGAGAESGERLVCAEQIGKAVADRCVERRRRRQHRAVGIGEHEAAAGARSPIVGKRLRQHLLRAGQRVGRRLRQPRRSKVGDSLERRRHVGKRLAAVVEHLHHGADADGGEKGDDQHRHRAAQQGLGRQQAPIRRLGDRLREAFDRIRTRRRTRRFGARHDRPPFGMSPTTRSGKDVPHPVRISGDWN